VASLCQSVQQSLSKHCVILEFIQVSAFSLDGLQLRNCSRHVWACRHVRACRDVWACIVILCRPEQEVTIFDMLDMW
jgi:hypothetical protein